MPFLSVLTRPEAIQENFFLGTIYDQLDFSDERSLIFALSIGSILLVISSSAFKTITLYVLNRSVNSQGTERLLRLADYRSTV